MADLIIIGAGISGLSLAYRYQQAQPAADIVVLEERSRVGGTIWTEREAGFQVELGPNGFLDNKPTTFQLCQDLRLQDDLVPGSEVARKNRYLCLAGRLHMLPNSFVSFLRSPLLSWRSKWALLTERWRRRRTVTGDESIADFALRRTNRELTDVLVDAFVTGIYAGDPKLLSVQACFPRLAQFEAEHGSILRGFAHSAKQRRLEAKAQGKVYERGSKLWSLRGGLRTLVETLSAHLRRPPILGCAVRSLRQEGTGWCVQGAGQEHWQAPTVVLTCPAYQQAALLQEVDTELTNRLSQIPYNKVGVVALGYRQAEVPHSLAGFGYLTPTREQRDVLGVQWCSSVYPDRCPAGTILLRAMVGGWHRPELVGYDDARLLALVRQELRATLGVTAEPIYHKIVRWDRAIPQYVLGHLENERALQARAALYPGLHLAGNSFRGVAMNDCTEQAGLLVAKLTKR